MRAFVESGQSKDRLLELLGEMDGVTRVDKVLSPREDLLITVRPEKNSMLWKVEAEKEGVIQEPKVWEGTKTSELFERIGQIYNETNIDDATSILALSSMRITKTYDGKFHTKWAKISPGLPYDVDQQTGAPVFEMIDFYLSESDLSICSESGLALYKEEEDAIFPIRECAFASIGKLMDCEACFRYKYDFPIGSALLLAERFASMTGVRMLLRNGHDNFHPLIGMCGPKYVQYSQKETLCETLEYIPSKYQEFQKESIKGTLNFMTSRTKYMYDIEHWVVTEEKTLVDIRLQTWDLHYDFVITLQTGDIPGTSIAIFAYAQFGPARVLLRKNSSYHWKCFKDNGRVAGLFEDVFPAMDRFEKAMAELEAREIAYQPELLDGLESPLGLTRFKETVEKVGASEFADRTMHGDELFRNILEATFCELPEKQSGELASAYGNLFNRLCGKDVVMFKTTSKERRSRRLEEMRKETAKRKQEKLKKASETGNAAVKDQPQENPEPLKKTG